MERGKLIGGRATIDPGTGKTRAAPGLFRPSSGRYPDECSGRAAAGRPAAGVCADLSGDVARLKKNGCPSISGSRLRRRAAHPREVGGVGRSLYTSDGVVPVWGIT